MSTTTEMIWEGAEALRPYLRPVDELKPSEENPRKGDVMALVGSLRRFGQVRAIAVTTDDVVVAGHHLRLAAIEMGWTHIAAVPNEFASDEERKAYLLADNQLAALGGYDEQAQLTLLDEMEANLEGTGFTIDDVETFRANFGNIDSAAPMEVARGTSEDAQAAAERAAALAQSRQMREIVLMVTSEQHAEFGEYMKVLQAEYKSEETPTPGVVYTTLRAVKERAEQLRPAGEE